MCTSHFFNLLVVSVETIQYSVKTKYVNVRLGIILEVFKGGGQIYIQMKA